ncbi:response regulator transcription factor [Magnetospirillum sp. SS-4]|uniref:response regulator n=1 Tax=Magnetospirillum sp. SS-4 TaxID=2681465 RepID=UPI001384D063|nr:response regulator transcription factor [Magnetospirillum sp. SS-4]CAA7612335.1 Glycerol metabolism activator [Magnetospirillum sp. SS-4]
MVKALIIDDHPLFREALTFVISRLDDESVCVEAESMEQATTLLGGESAFDLILLDLGLPGASGLAGILGIRSLAPSTPVVVVSAIDDADMIQRAACFGVSGYITKNCAGTTMHTALAKVLAGDTHFPAETGGAVLPSHIRSAELETLTPRQLTVLRLLGEAKSNKQIAYELSISQETVKIHISAILRKLGASNRAQAVLMAHQMR